MPLASPSNPPTGTCSYTEGQFLFTTSWGESVYAHFYNGVLFAAYRDGSGFKPQHWLVDTGQMTSSVASCFAENDPHTTTTPTQNPNPTPTTSPVQAGSNFAGSFDGADCNGISGWVVNKNTPHQSTKFDVYINGWLAAAGVPATRSRQDVSNALGISGYNAFGFNINLPGKYKAGVPLTISVKYAGTSTHIPGSPKTTVACGTEVGTSNFDPECQTGIARVFPGGEQASSTGVAYTGTIALKLSGKDAGSLPSLTSRLIPVKQGDHLSLDAYAFAPVLTKHNLTPRLTMAAVGGVITGLTLTQHQTSPSDQGRTIQSIPTIGVSTALMIPLVKSLLANRLPRASVELAFYDKQGTFVHRQQINVTKAAREGWELMHIDGYTPQDGYVRIRLQNQSKAPVWFDDLRFQATPDQGMNAARTAALSPKLLRSPSGFTTHLPINNESIYQASRLSPCPSHTGGAILDPGSSWPGVWLDIDVTVTVTATGSTPTKSTGSGSTYTESGSSNFRPLGAPVRPPVGTSYVTSSGVEYIYDGGSWCIPLPAVDVKGTPPTITTEGDKYIYVDPNFGYSVTYKFVDGRWTLPVESISATLPTPKPIYTNEPLCCTLKRMWKETLDANGQPLVEVMALITSQGIVILPVAGINCSGEYHANKFNESYANYLGDFSTIVDAQGNKSQRLKLCDGTEVDVYGAIHTHPSTAIGNPFQPSPADINWAANHSGITSYILGKDGLLKFDSNGYTYPSLSAQDLANCICP